GVVGRGSTRNRICFAQLLGDPGRRGTTRRGGAHRAEVRSHEMEVKTFLRSQWDRVAACCLVILGAPALVLGWFGVSGTGLAAEQNPYLISGGLVGLALIGVGCTLWLS